MFGTNFYHGILRSLVTGFGTIFNDIQVERRDAVGNVVQTIQVPIEYGPKEKWYYRLMQDPNAGNTEAGQTTQLPVQMILPRMSFEVIGIQPNGSRRLPATLKHVNVIENDQGHLSQTYIHVPITVMFQLNILSRNLLDSLQIIEQIIPWFNPSLTVQMKLLPEFERTFDVIFTIQYPIVPQDHWAGDFTDRRDLTWSINFSVDAMVYGPIKNKPIILEGIVRAFGGITDTEPGSTVTVTPNPADAQANEVFDFTVTNS